MSKNRSRIGQGMFDWIRTSRAESVREPMREAYERPRGEGYYEASPWPPTPSRYPMREIQPEFRSSPPREEPGMFKWIAPSRTGMSGPGNSSSGWLVGLSVAIGFGIAAALAYFSMPGQQRPPQA